MKIRQGFVSNSSSSSFIVTFDKVPETAEELREVLNLEHAIESKHWDGTPLDPAELAKWIFNDMKDGRNNKKNILSYLGHEYWGDDGESWNEYLEDCTIGTYKEMVNILNKNKEKFIYCFSFSDEDGAYGSFLEHGNIFKNLKYKCKSHH